MPNDFSGFIPPNGQNMGGNFNQSGAERGVEKLQQNIRQAKHIRSTLGHVVHSRASLVATLKQWNIDLVTSAKELDETGDFVTSSYVIYRNHNDFKETLFSFLQRYPDFAAQIKQIEDSAQNVKGKIGLNDVKTSSPMHSTVIGSLNGGVYPIDHFQPNSHNQNPNYNQNYYQNNFNPHSAANNFHPNQVQNPTYPNYGQDNMNMQPSRQMSQQQNYYSQNSNLNTPNYPQNNGYINQNPNYYNGQTANFNNPNGQAYNQNLQTASNPNLNNFNQDQGVQKAHNVYSQTYGGQMYGDPTSGQNFHQNPTQN